MVAGCPDLNGQAARYSKSANVDDVHYNPTRKGRVSSLLPGLAILPHITSY